jgi:two-component system, sensor histidine kinase ChiS
MKNNAQSEVSRKALHVLPLFFSGIFFLAIFNSLDCFSQDTNTYIGTRLWWSTWWAFSLYGLFFVAILYLMRRYELNRIRLKNQLKLEKIKTDALRSTDRVKSQFFADISHEFRTPLTLILGQVESVMSSGIGTREKAKLQVADRNARKLLTLINQLLDLSKLEAGSMKLDVSQHNFVSFIKGLFFSFESLAALKKISLLFEAGTDNIPVIFDPDKMEKIFYNLVSNAVKFSEVNGKVQISIHLIKPNIIEIRVENNGRGIPAEQLPYIFDRFYQVDHSDTQKYEGTGIGLALARELVEMHHGTITVESDEWVSTVFIVRLRVSEIKPEQGYGEELVADRDFSAAYYTDDDKIEDGKSVSEPAISSGESREIVLIVDDNNDVREFIHELLENEYLIHEAENGNTGIIKARETIPDLIITDLMMPVMDGYKFCKKIRKDERTSHIPIIMLTAKADFDDKMEGLETGIDDYIIKPFSTKELKARIRNLINQRRLLRARFSQATIFKPSEVAATSMDKVFLEKMSRVIEANFEKQDFTVESLAAEFKMSTSQLNRKLNALIGQPGGQVMRSLRLQRAAQLLEMKAGTVAQICYQLGFNDQAYFSRAFRKQFGCSPVEYIKG